jgi:hypothetical protein
VAGVVGLAAAVSVPLVWAAQQGGDAVPAPGEVSFWSPGRAVDGSTDTDGRAVELGLRFTSGVAGSVTGVRFYKPRRERGKHTGSLWDDQGSRLATATFSSETRSGWQQARFSRAVPVVAGRTYTVSYHTDDGIYLSKEHGLATGLRAGPLVAGPDGGVYTYAGSAFPTDVWHASNYFVDVLFRPSSGSGPVSVPVPSSPAASPTQSASPSAAPSTARPTSPTGAPPTGPTQVPTGFPDASNTGVPKGTSLTKRSEPMVVRQDGTVIDAVDLTGYIDVYANNVVIRRSKISGTSWWGVNLRAGYANLTVEDCEIFGNGVQQMQYGIASAGGWVTARRNNVHTISNGIDVPIGLIEDNYVHDPKYFAGDHTDTIMSEGGAPKGTTLTIRHNTAVNTLNQTGAVALFADWGPQHDVVVERNLLVGGGYSLYAGAAGSSNLRIVDNVFSRRVWPNGGYYGPVAHWDAAGSGNVWQGNHWEDGKPVNP